jgi:hypothetical protein
VFIVYKLTRAASATSGASPQKHVYVRFMSMFVMIYVCMSFGFQCLVYILVCVVDTCLFCRECSREMCVMFYDNAIAIDSPPPPILY